MDLKQAREILGVPEDAIIDQVEERYTIMIKRHKASTDLDNTEKPNLEEINSAYQLLKSDITGIPQQGKSIKDSSLKEKLDHYLYYYKFHLIGGIILFIMVFYFISSMDNQSKADMADHPPEEFNIIMFGNYQKQDNTSIEEVIASTYPNWKDANFDIFYQPAEINSQFDMGTMVKNQATLSQTNPDVFILDKHNFELFVEDGTFVPLDGLPLETVNESRLYFSTTEDDSTERLYGIDVSGSKIFDGVNIPGEKIAVIAATTNEMENAESFLKKLIEGI